jgi:hypothetical protein
MVGSTGSKPSSGELSKELAEFQKLTRAEDGKRQTERQGPKRPLEA